MTKPAAKVKLTAAQQEVVNLMAAGRRLTYSPHSGRFGSARATLSGPGGKVRRVPSNVPFLLQNKGVVEKVQSEEWRFSTYQLTTEGKALAGKVEQPKSQETWWRVCGESITPQHFARSTDTCLIDFDGQKRAKHTQWDDFFPSKAAAIAHIRRELTGDVRNAEAALKRAKQALADFEKSTPAATEERE